MMTEDHREISASDHVVVSEGLTVEVIVAASGVVGTAPTDTLGLEASKTYRITASPLDPAEGTYHYEMLDSDGKSIASGVGNELSDALLGFAVSLEDQQKGD